MAALFRSERPWLVFKEKICTRYSQFLKKNLKVICALAGIAGWLNDDDLRLHSSSFLYLLAQSLSMARAMPK